MRAAHGTLARMTSEVSEVAGWVREQDVTTLCRYVAAYTQTSWDDLDQEALDGLLDETDAEAGKWFEYPLGGTPGVVVKLANDPGSALVQVRVIGQFDEVLRARFDTLVDVL